MTLEMHSECIQLRRFSLHSEYGKMPAHDFLIGRNQPTVRPSQVQRPMTHCGVMASWNCEGFHRRRLMSWVTCHRKQVENVTFEAVTSGKSKFQTVEKYLNSLTRTACSTVYIIHFNRRQIRHGDQPWYLHVLWPLRWTIAHSTWMVPLFHQDYTRTMDKNWTVCFNGVHTHTIFHTHTTLSHIIFLCHTPFFTYNIIQLCHTQLFFTSWSSTTSFVFPSFPVPATTFGAHYWKKLPCGVIRSFNLANIKHAMLSQYAAALAWASAQGARTEQNRWATPVPHLSFPFDCCCLPFLR